MTEKRVSVRLSATGGRQVKAELEGVGEAGSRGFGRLSREMEGANARLAALGAAGSAAGWLAGWAVCDDHAGAAGAVVVAASFAFRGHALEEPRVLLGLLITVHILGLSFWVGAFAPLAQASARGEADVAGPLAQEFGHKALWVVGALVAAGALTLLLFGAATPAALATPYGQAFAVKLALFAGVLLLAALNKMRLTRALLAATPGAGSRLRRSIGVEAALVGTILLTTAAVTTVTSPPENTEQAVLLEERHDDMAARRLTRNHNAS